MKLVKSLLLGSAAGLATVVAAQAADLPTRKAAPVEYVRVCDAYGAGFFYIPGTDTCLRVGGLALAAMAIQPSTELYRVSVTPGAALAPIAGTGFYGFVPGTAAYGSNNSREILGYAAVGRVELDARTQSPYGTVRTFVRLQATFGSGQATGQTGSLSSSIPGAFNLTAGPSISKEISYLDKAFIQFAGITAGRVQSFFDFYADAINYAGLWGSNSTVWAAAYTYTFGGGFSVTGAIEDSMSRRGPVYNVAAVGGIAGVTPAGTLGAAGGVGAFVGRAVMPDIVGVLRWDQPWGAAQLSGALHNVTAHMYPATSVGVGFVGQTTYANPVVSASRMGFALQGGLQFNLDVLAPGDKLWLQATYAKGAIGYVQGNNLTFVGGLNGTSTYGVGFTRSSNGIGWTSLADGDCVFNYTGTCDMSSAFAVIAALKHYWTPTLSSGFFGNYYQVQYSAQTNTPINPFFFAGFPGQGTAATSGITNYSATRIGTNLVWTPVKNFDIGAEVTWAHYMSHKQLGLAPDYILNGLGLPRYKATTDQFLGQLRMIRAF